MYGVSFCSDELCDGKERKTDCILSFYRPTNEICEANLSKMQSLANCFYCEVYEVNPDEEEYDFLYGTTNRMGNEIWLTKDKLDDILPVVGSKMKFLVQSGLGDRYVGLDPKVDLKECVYHIVRRVSGKEIVFPISSSDIIWNIASCLFRRWYERRTEVTLDDVIDIYNEVRRLQLQSEDKERMFGQRNCDVGCRRCMSQRSINLFSKWFDKNIYAILRNNLIRDLWYQNDPKVHPGGVGNLVVWLPNEMIEDVIGFEHVDYDIYAA